MRVRACLLKMVYQSSNTRAMSKSIQATSKQSQPHQEENNKQLLSTAKSGAGASAHQQQSHHSRMAHEYVNVKSPCRRESQSALPNQKPVYRSEAASGHQLMATGAKYRNDHKIDGHHSDSSGDNRVNSSDHQQQQRQNGAPMSDIYADDDLAEVNSNAFTTYVISNCGLICI